MGEKKRSIERDPRVKEKAVMKTETRSNKSMSRRNLPQGLMFHLMEQM